MKTAEIEPGGKYRVHLSERTSLIYRGCDVVATVVRAGFRYEVETVTASRVRGAPFHRFHESSHATGVEVRWERQEVPSNRRYGGGTEVVHPGRAIVNSRSVIGVAE